MHTTECEITAARDVLDKDLGAFGSIRLRYKAFHLVKQKTNKNDGEVMRIVARQIRAKVIVN